MYIPLIWILIIFTILIFWFPSPEEVEEDLVYFSKVQDPENWPAELPIIPDIPADIPKLSIDDPIDIVANYEYEFVANVSAYCHCKKCSGKYGKSTSSGKTVQEFHTIAMDKKFPFGTKVVFLDYEPFKGIIFTVEDRFGKGDHGNKIDVYHTSHAAALKFGRRQLKVGVYYESP